MEYKMYVKWIADGVTETHEIETVSSLEAAYSKMRTVKELWDEILPSIDVFDSVQIYGEYPDTTMCCSQWIWN